MPFQNFRRGWLGVAVTALLFTLYTPNAAISSVTRSAAQTGNTVTVDGSNIVSPILRAASDAYKAVDAATTVDVQISGTGGGFEKLCNGTLDIAMAARAITDSEAAACQAKAINFVELLLGYDALVLVVNQQALISCISLDQVNKLIGPNAQGITNWNATDPTQADTPISSVYITSPADQPSQIRTLADNVLTGEGIRPDLTIATDATDLAAKVGTQINAVGVLTLKDYNDVPKTGIKALQLRNGTSCIDPTVANLDEGRYEAGQSLYLYTNAASLERSPVSSFLTYLLGTTGRRVVRESGFVQASETIYDRGVTYVTTKQVGRTFSRIQSVNIPAETTGTVTLDGSPALLTALRSVSSSFQPRYSRITVNTNLFGDDAGFRKLCLNTVDVIGSTRAQNDAEAQACQNLNVQTLRLNIGQRAVVAVVNANNTFAACLKSDEVGKIFGSAGTATTWKQVNDSFPETPILALVPTLGAPETDLLLNKTQAGQISPTRRLKDVTESGDALYRAAGVKNVEGAVTYLSWADYQAALAQNMALKAIAIDTGNGCADPTEANIKDGKYAVSDSLTLYLNVNSFARPEVRAFVWYLLSDDALAGINKSGLVNVDAPGFVAARDLVLERFSAVTANAGTSATAVPSATTPPTSNIAPTAQATAEATTAATTVATAEATAAATAEATAAPTAEATPAP
jgi:phosphate transport system substrate-binding protein